MSGKWVEIGAAEYVDLYWDGGKRRKTVETDGESHLSTKWEKWVEDKPEPTADLILWSGRLYTKATYYKDGVVNVRYNSADGASFTTTLDLARSDSPYTELVAVPKKEWDQLVWDHDYSAEAANELAAIKLVQAWRGLIK